MGVPPRMSTRPMSETAKSLAVRAETVTAPERTNQPMTPSGHDAVVRRSFEAQVGLFSGDDSPFARRAPSPLAWVEPLDPEMVVLDVATDRKSTRLNSSHLGISYAV